MSSPEQRFVDAAAATSLGDRLLPDPEEVWLERFRDSTLLVLAVVAHLHGATRTKIWKATGQFPISVALSLRSLARAGLVERERRPGRDFWYATHEGTRLGVAPYVVRLLDAAVPRYRADPAGGWVLTRGFKRIGTEKGPRLFRPSVALAEVNDVGALGEVIRSGIHDDRAYALTKLIGLRDPASVPVLCEVAMRRDEDEPLARESVVALGSFDTPAAAAVLIDVLSHRDSWMREAAARSLGRLGCRQAVPALTGCLDYPSEAVRAAAATALGRIGDSAACDPLRTLLADPNREVRHAARHALRKLSGA